MNKYLCLIHTKYGAVDDIAELPENKITTELVAKGILKPATESDIKAAAARKKAAIEWRKQVLAAAKEAQEKAKREEEEKRKMELKRDGARLINNDVQLVRKPETKSIEPEAPKPKQPKKKGGRKPKDAGQPSQEK